MFHHWMYRGEEYMAIIQEFLSFMEENKDF
jgi:hypothetical protein